MKFKEYLQKLIAGKKKRAEELRNLIKAAQTADEVRSLGDELAGVNAEITEAQEQLDGLEDDGDEGDEGDDTRANVPDTAEMRGGNPIASYMKGQPQTSQKREKESVLDSMEYRQAFANYVRTGVWNYEQRDGEVVSTQSIGKIIPTTVMKELIKQLKSYGQLYSRVRKLNVQGGVEIPIEELVPAVKWITETTTSETQKAPEVKASVSFGYHIAEARIAQTLLSSVVALDMLESEIATVLAEAFVREFDRIIISGTGKGQPTGILNDTRVPADHKIKMTEADAEDWTQWRKKLFAKIPLRYRGGGILIMTVDTWEGLICTMKDANGRPLYSETYDVQTGDTIYRFNGKEVVPVEADLGLYDYSAATADQPYMIYFKPTDYAINSNLQIGYKRYYDEDNNKWVNKGLTIMDGKLLDVNSAFIIRK